ncbi:MAG TPA: Holliday junction resolvase RuvX [Gemmatimonadaceae bacterium]|nr:Holliday junction resolvase RuvX [Gemmatimonadaceae bacterium]
MNAALARFLAVDYGRKRIGLAISDPLGMIASPAGFIERREGKRPPITKIVARATELDARGYLLGLPLDGEGNETPWTAEVRALGAEIAKRTGMPVRFLDERFTTAVALRTVKEMGESTRGRKGDVDSLAATILLQRALNVPS